MGLVNLLFSGQQTFLRLNKCSQAVKLTALVQSLMPTSQKEASHFLMSITHTILNTFGRLVEFIFESK